MVDRLTRTILSFLVILSAYWLYALFVVPRIDPGETAMPGPKYEEAKFRHDWNPTDRFRHLLEPLFPADSWERNQAMVLKDDENTFLLIVGDYETANERMQLRLKPCTVVLNPPVAQDDAKSSPGECIILTALDGAELDFDRPFEITHGRIGKLIGGRLVGDVSIRSHSTDKESPHSPRNQLEVVTRNVQMNAQQIWTPHAVQFRYGQSFGAGRDLMINLTEIESTDLRRLPSENPTHLRTLELVHLDHLTISNMGGSSAAATQPSPRNSTTLAVRCQGPLLFDFVGGSVTLNDQVALRRIDGDADRSVVTTDRETEPDQGDWIACDLLVMHFLAQSGNDATIQTQDAPINRPRPQWKLPEFELSQIVAFGSPAIVEAPTYKVHAEAEKIEYHLLHSRLLLQDAEQALLRYDTHTFRGLRMHYFADPQRGPGRAEIEGRGEYVGSMKDGLVQLQWRDSLSFGPEDGLYLLEVDGEANARWGSVPRPRGPQPNGIDQVPTHQLAARNLSIWLRKTPSVPTGFRPVAYDQELENQRHAPDVVAARVDGWTPDHMEARGRVRLRTPQVAGDVEFAEVRWHQDSPTLFAKRNDHRTGPALGTPLGLPHQPGKPTERFMLTGHDVRVVLENVDDGSTPRLKSIKIRGGVHLRQATENPRLADLEIKGAIVELEQKSDSGAVGRVSGEPAMVKTRDVELTGRDIQVDQTRNRIWIDDSGSAFLPLPQHVAARLSRRTATMQIAWQGGMVFDGESVACEKNVEIRGPAQIATADVLQATLAQPIHFDSLSDRRYSSAKQATFHNRPAQALATISLQGNVWAESRSFDEQGLASIDEFHLPSLTFDQTTGQLVGEGPGWISSVRYAKQRTTTNTRQPNNGRAETSQLTHTLIEFQKQLNGSLTKREVSVHDRVRAIHGPIRDWKERIRFDDSRRSPETITMRSTRLTVAQMPSGNGETSLEFAASGNTQIEGGTFIASAQHVRYAQAKDMLVMEGDGRSVARLSYQRRVGAPRNDAAARKIQYWIGENRAKIEGVVFGDVTNPVTNQDPIQRPPPANTPAHNRLLPQQGQIFGRYYSQPNQTAP